MRNVISINALNNCNCDLLANVDDGSNAVVLEIKADTSKNPKLEIHRETVTIDSDLFTYTIKQAWYVAQMGALTFRIVDDEHTGDEFSIEGVSSIKGNLLLKQNSNFSYTLVDIAEDDPQTVVLSPKRLTNEKLGGYYGEDRIGLYYASKGNTVVDKPAGVDGFYLEVNRSEYNYYYQLMFPSNQLRDTLWMRSHAAAGGWSEWVQVGGPADSALSATSTNPVQNKVIRTELNKKQSVYGAESGNSGSDKAGYWYKLFTLRVTARYGSAAVRANIYTEGDGTFTPNKSAVIQCRLKAQDEMGANGQPQRGISVIASDRFTADQFRICIVTNTTTLIAAEVWVKVVDTYQFHVINV